MMEIIVGLTNNIFFWITICIGCLIVFLLMFILLFVLGKKTHAIIEFKAWLNGKPIALFFGEDRYCEWKPVDTEAGIIQDKKYGAFIINGRASYIDRKTKNALLPFDTSFGASINVHAAKLIDDLQYIVKDQSKMNILRNAIYKNLVDDSETITALKTSVYFGAIKTMMNALIPHNIDSKIEKTIAARLDNYNKVNVPQALLYGVAVIGALVLGGIFIKIAFPGVSG